MSKQPALRFEGCMDDWIHCEFKNCFALLKNNTLSRAELNYEQGEILNIHYGDILVKFGEIIDLCNDRLPYITDTAKGSNSTFLQNGDLIIADTAEDSSVGKCAEITEISDISVVSGLHTIPCRPYERFAKGYLGYLMNSPAYHNQLLPLMQGTKVTAISKSALQDTVLHYPHDKREQADIGCLFMSLDKIITLHQHKYDKLLTYKKAMLEKMFPKDGADVPEIRVSGFFDKWKMVKFSQLFGEKRELTETEDEDTLLSCAIDGMYLNSELFGHFRGSSNIGYLKVKKNDLILSAQNLHLGNVNVNLRFDHGIISPAYKVFKLQGCDPYFINTWMKRDVTKDFFLSVTTEGASQCRKNIEWSSLFEKGILIPTEPEQLKIGKFFSQLDVFIELLQSRMDALKKIKAALLNKMFI